MHPYTAHENAWLSEPARSAEIPGRAEESVALIDDAVIRMHMRRGERMRSQEVRRLVVVLFRLPGAVLRACGSYLKPATAGQNH
ncbi:MAG: hypothetical protein NXI18_07190 [Alphaproteobacteria bacterium]|nr:hypothetical protein [Alphaproteobacteria bacterium]